MIAIIYYLSASFRGLKRLKIVILCLCIDVFIINIPTFVKTVKHAIQSRKYTD